MAVYRGNSTPREERTLVALTYFNATPLPCGPSILVKDTSPSRGGCPRQGVKDTSPSKFRRVVFCDPPIIEGSPSATLLLSSNGRGHRKRVGREDAGGRP